MNTITRGDAEYKQEIGRADKKVLTIIYRRKTIIQSEMTMSGLRYR
jgi:hypothetical protein